MKWLASLIKWAIIGGGSARRGVGGDEILGGLADGDTLPGSEVPVGVKLPVEGDAPGDGGVGGVDGRPGNVGALPAHPLVEFAGIGDGFEACVARLAIGDAHDEVAGRVAFGPGEVDGASVVDVEASCRWPEAGAGSRCGGSVEAQWRCAGCGRVRIRRRRMARRRPG